LDRAVYSPDRADIIGVMISGLATHANGSIALIDTLEAARHALSQKESVVWVDLEAPTEAELHGLGETANLSAEALEDCVHGEQRPRVDEYDDHFFMLLYGLLGAEGQTDVTPRKLAAFLGPRFLITAHTQQLRTIAAMRDRCARNSSKALSDGVDGILYRIIDGMVDKYLLVADQYELLLQKLEDRSLEETADDELIPDVNSLRRKLLELRRLAVSQRELVAPLAGGEFDHISDSLEARFRHVADHLAQVIDVVDSMRERLNGVRDNYHTALADRTNAAMKTLTTVATIMLPMSLVAGIYGMNVPIWPEGNDPRYFWALVGFMALLGGGLAVLFRRMRWL
jgi:magnesium transporter